MFANAASPTSERTGTLWRHTYAAAMNSKARSDSKIWRWGDDDREIFRLALPSLGALVAEPLYVLADTAVVGHIGTDQLGGLALASSLLLIGHAIFIFLAYGTTSAVARLLGAGEDRRAAHQAVQSVWLALLVGVVFSLVILVLSGPLVSLMGAKGAIRTNALIYLRYSLIGVPALLVSLAGVGYLRGLQDTKRPLLVAVGTALFNLVAELILINGFGMAIAASALTTVVAQVIAAATYIHWIRQAVEDHDVGLRPEHGTMLRLAGDGVNLLVRTIALRGGLTLTLAVASRIGSDDLAAHEIAFEIWMVIVLALDAVAIAAQALVGRALGAGDAAEARRIGRRAIVWGAGSGVVLGGAALAASPFLPSIFSNDPAVTSLAAFLLLHVGFSQPIGGVVFALDGVLIGAGDLRYLAWAMSAASMGLVAVGVAVLVVGAGIGWLWAGLELWLALRAVTLLLRFRGTSWQVLGARGSS